MTPPTIPSLNQVTGILQLAVRNTGRMNEVAPMLSSAVSQLGDLSHLNLPGWAGAHLQRIAGGGSVLGEPDVKRSLAYLAAEIGARESQAADHAKLSEATIRGPRAAIEEIFSTIHFSAPPPKPGSMALQRNPFDGFRPFRTNLGTEVAYFPTPESLGPPWDQMIKGQWSEGVGLLIFRNREADTVGMIFIHSLGKVRWSKLGPVAWQSSGGSMAFPESSLRFIQSLSRVVDKGVAMTYKWRATDESIGRGTDLGGSKGMFLYGEGEGAKEKGLRVYAEVLSLIGLTLTGSDEGVDPASADFLAELAPLNVYGSDKSAYKGRKPTRYTAEGLFEGLKVILSLRAKHREHHYPVLAVGYGGIGEPLVKSLMKENIAIAGVVERSPSRLLAAKRAEVDAPLYRDLGGEGWTLPNILTWPYWRLRGIRTGSGLADVVRRSEGARIVSPNGGPHPITFDLAKAMIESGIEVVAGAANNQHAFDTQGSPIPMAWILQAAGIFNPADFVINRLGATAVVSMAINLSDYDMRRQIKRVGETVREDYEEAYLKNTPPYVYQWEKAAHAWNESLASGRGMGGRSYIAESRAV